MEISNAHITLAAASAVDVAASVTASASVPVSLATLTHFHDTQMSKIIAVKYAKEVKILPPSPCFYCRRNRKVSKRKVRLLEESSKQKKEKKKKQLESAAGEDCSLASRESRLLFDSSLSQGDRELNSNSKNTK